MQITDIKKIHFRHTVHAAGLLCMVCNFHPAELHITAISGPATVNIVACPKCSALDAVFLETILFPVRLPETRPAMVAGF